MCQLCRQYPCHSACPNAPEEQPVLQCDECKKGIYAGEYYYADNGWYTCEKCNDKKRKLAGEN